MSQVFPSTLMKKLGLQFSSATLLLSTLASKAFAQFEDPPNPGLAEETDITAVIINVIQIILNVILVIAVLFLIIAGVRLIVSSGDEGEKEKAKKTIIYVIAGIIIIIFARAIVIFVKDQLLNA